MRSTANCYSGMLAAPLRCCLGAGAAGRAADLALRPLEGDYVIHDFHFASGETLPELRMHYTMLGKPHSDAHGQVNNAVLILHGTGGSGRSLLNEHFAGVLFGKGQLLDTNKYFIILPDGIGHGKSSKPSDGLHAHFPQYTYHGHGGRAVRPAHQGPRGGPPAAGDGHLDGLHAHLHVGRDLSGFHGCPDAARLPAGADRRAATACGAICSCDAIRNDPQWQQGDYKSEPMGALRTAAGLLLIAGSAPIQMQITLPTRDAADQFLEKFMQRETRGFGRQRSALPGQRIARLRSLAGLEKIKAPLTADQLGR